MWKEMKCQGLMTLKLHARSFLLQVYQRSMGSPHCGSFCKYSNKSTGDIVHTYIDTYPLFKHDVV